MKKSLINNSCRGNFVEEKEFEDGDKLMNLPVRVVARL